MTKDKALYAFFNHLVHKWEAVGGQYVKTDEYVTAYVDTNVMDENGNTENLFPRLTYTAVFDSWGGEPVSLTVNLWDRVFGESVMNEMAFEISKAIGYGGKIIPCDGGYIWLKRGSPFCTSLTDSVDTTIKRRYINVTAEYLTFN